MRARLISIFFILAAQCARAPFSGLSDSTLDCDENLLCYLPSLYILSLPAPDPVPESCGGGEILAVVDASVSEGQSATVRVSVSSPPTCPLGLSIRADSSSDSVVFPTPASARITSMNFMEFQEMIALGAHDQNYDPETATIILSSTSTDIAPTTIALETIDDDRVMFVTGYKWNGDLESAGGGANGVLGADNLCASEATRMGGMPGSPGDYQALLIDGSKRTACVHAYCDPPHPGDHSNWVLKPNTAYFRPDGTLIGETNALAFFDFREGPLTAPVRHYIKEYWSGLNFFRDWTGGNNCAGWDTSGDFDLGDTGQSGSYTSDLLFNGVRTCNDRKSLICVQQ